MVDHRSTLQISLVDDVSPEARVMGEAMLRAAAQAKQLDEVLARSGASQKLQEGFRRMGATIPQVEGATKAMRALAEAEGIAADKAQWTAAQAKEMKSLELITVAAVRAQMREQAAKSRAEAEAATAAIRESERVAAQRIRDAERVADVERRARDRELLDMRRHNERMLEERRSSMERMGFGHYVAGSVAAGVSAHGVVSAAESAVEKGAELQDTRLGLTQAGITPQAAARIEQQALALSTRYANVSQTAIMELAKEARSVLQNPEEIGPTVETLAAAKSVLDARDASGKSSEGLGSLVKGAESIGAAKDPDRLRMLIDSYVRAIQVMGKTINPEQIYEFDKQAKTAGARMSDRFLMTTGLSLAQEMRGDSAGTGIAAAEKSIAMGFGKNHQSVRNMAAVGLIRPEDVDYLKGTHEAKGLKPGRHMVDANVAAADLDLWVYNTLLPALEKHGMKTEGSQLDFVMRTFTGTGADVVSKLITQRSAFENHAKLYPQAAGISAADNWDSATKGLTAFNNAMGNLLSNATLPIMGAAGRSLFSISEGLNRLAQAAKDHPLLGVAGAAGAAAGGLAASGYVGYQVMNGFGLGASATALDASAVALGESAAALTASAGVKAAGAAAGLVGGAEAAIGSAAGLSGAALSALAAAGFAVMGGTVYWLSHGSGPHSRGRGVSADTIPPPQPAPESQGPVQGRTNLPSAPDNSAVGQGTGRGFVHKSAYVTGDDFTGMSSAEAMIARGTQSGFEAAFRNIMGGGGGGGLSGGGGIVQASYETGDGASMGGGAGRTTASPSLRYGRGAGGQYRTGPSPSGTITGGGLGSLGAGDAVGIAEGLLGANGARAASMLHSKMTPGEWCADFVNGVLKGAGGHGVNSSMARAFAHWGHAVGLDQAKRGDVILEQHGDHIGHVGMATGRVRRDASGRITAVEMISGNYGHAVRKNWERPGIIAGLRRGDVGHPETATHEQQGPRLPRRAPRGTTEAFNDGPIPIFDHDNIHGAIHAVRQLKREVADLGKASVSVVHGPRNGGRTQLASRSDVGRHARGLPSTSGATFV